MAATPRLLMCRPDHFEVRYVINPWMRDHVQHIRRERALAQWEALHATLAALAEIHLMPPVAELPDLVFTANAGLILGDRVVPSRFRHAERRPEELHDAIWFAAHGFAARPMPDGLAFEGAGDALFDRAQPRLWFGHGHRSDGAAADALAATLGIEVVALRLVDPRFYHLDTCFCPLRDGHLLYYPPAFDSDARATIEARIPASHRIVVGEGDALDFACNAVNLAGAVVLNRASPALRRQLAERGFVAIEVDVGEFLKAGGAVKCLCLRLDEPVLRVPTPAPTASPAADADARAPSPP